VQQLAQHDDDIDE
jgi:hypothetical protein